MNEEKSASEAGDNQSEDATEMEDEAAFSIFRERILGGNLFVRVHPQISLLRDNDQTIVATIIFDDTPHEGEILVRNCNIFDMSQIASSLVEGMLRGLEGIDKSKGRILSMPGEKQQNLNVIRETIQSLESVAKMMDALLK